MKNQLPSPPFSPKLRLRVKKLQNVQLNFTRTVHISIQIPKKHFASIHYWVKRWILTHSDNIFLYIIFFCFELLNYIENFQKYIKNFSFSQKIIISCSLTFLWKTFNYLALRKLYKSEIFNKIHQNIGKIIKEKRDGKNKKKNMNKN